MLILRLISVFLTHFMTSFWLVLVPLIPRSSLFLLTFSFYFIHLIILNHSDILLDFRSILIEFLAHILSPCFLVFLLQVWPFSGSTNARHGLRGRARECKGAYGALGSPRTRWCTRTCYWCTRTFSDFRGKSQNTTVRPHEAQGAVAPVAGAPAPTIGAPAPSDGWFHFKAEESGAPAPDIWCARTMRFRKENRGFIKL